MLPRPWPAVPMVEKPSRIARCTSAMPGPLSRASISTGVANDVRGRFGDDDGQPSDRVGAEAMGVADLHRRATGTPNLGLLINDDERRQPWRLGEPSRQAFHRTIVMQVPSA